ncbi:hypothetical protein CYLTODRAFT_454652 [Cylindrobasidium torrendii FP15055 ss-10]|uniref:Alpha/beta-hydrolase n=1 Tax=Cylindrobasidium torrendii FP15055 ss-10 TaxID=1314674 RepID=A0A0D7BCI4_9AGAR|nr:hypothetical protein CYLTODRAFT_454652 [Cylindrobasidium torrendii FP15055 ss-10]
MPSHTPSFTTTTLLLSVLAATAGASVIRRQQHNEVPTPPGSLETGWESLPDVPDADLILNFPVDDGVTIPVYQSSGKDNASITRAVMVYQGKWRDCWAYFNMVQNALYNGAYSDPEIDDSTISIMAPCFMAEQDVTAGAVTDQAIWGDTTWISGHYNIGPESVKDVSSYDVIDKLVDYYMDAATFPNLKELVIAGHSAGGQVAQRYAALRSPTKNDDRLHYWIGNPGSLVWLTPDRPAPNDACEGFDDYKYGLADKLVGYALADSNDMGRDGMVDRYIGRNVHYAWGLEDNGPGDTRCQAITQGSTHLERGQNFASMLEGLGGGSLPSTQTVDWVPGVSHDGDAMMNSDAGIAKLFKD